MNENEIKKPKGFLWMDEWADLTADLTDEQLGKLLRASQNFHMDIDYDIGEDKELKMAFRFITVCIKANDEKYERACKLKAEGGRRGRQKQLEQMRTNASISQDMPTNVDYQNINENPNENINTNQNPNENKTPLKKGEGDTPAPAREGFEDFELFGILHNVKLKPAHVRHLHETYGVEIADETIDDLSCKLADGSVNSADHYATLLTWLRWRRRTDAGTVPMSSAQAQPESKPENDYSYAEECFLKAWQEYDKTTHTETDKYWYLNQLAKDGGATPRMLTLIGLKLIDNQWLFDNEQTDK